MKLSDLTDMLAMDVPGCPSATLRDALRWAQRELCNEGNVWIVSDEPVVSGAGTDEAELEVPAGAEAIRIIQLLLNGRALIPGRDYQQTGANAIQFLRNAPHTDDLMGALACRPAYGQDMPVALLGRWAEALLDGARSRLLVQPKPWRDLALADFHRRKFIDAQADARALARDGFQAGSVRMRAPRFA